MRFASLRSALVPTLAGLAALTLSSAASAAGGQWDTAAAGFNGSGTDAANPWISAPAAGSSYAEWNLIFGYPVDDTPDIGGAGTLTELTGTAFPTGGGNIYSFSSATAFQVDLAGAAFGSWDVYLRVASLGTNVADIATLNGVQATRVITFDGASGSAMGGAEQESLWHWSLTGSGDWRFHFNALEHSLSLDQVAVYAVAQTPAVPEPQTWALMVAGLAAVGVMSRRRA